MIELKFNDIKNDSAKLLMFLKAFPKGGDLHNHSLGGGYSEFLYDIAIERNFYFDRNTKFFLNKREFSELKDKSQVVSIEEFKNFYSQEFFDNYSIRGLKNPSNGREHFFQTFPMTISTKVTENELILQIANRNILENVQYLEIISDCIPENIISHYKEGFDLSSFSLDKMEEYIIKLEKLNTPSNYLEVKGFLDEREEYLKINLNTEITIKYLPYLRRVSSTLMEFFIEGYYSILYSFLDRRIGGINLVEVEDHVNSRKNFSSHLAILKFLYNYFEEKHNFTPNYSLHAGELTLAISPMEDMSSRIGSSIFLKHDFKPTSKAYTKRIGHGVSIPWEDNKTLTTLHMNNIPIEICLSSNEIILGVSYREHPFNFYKYNDIPMVICTDDEAVSRSNIIIEYHKAITRYDLSYSDLKLLIRNTLEFSFLRGEGLFNTHSKTFNKDFYSEVRKEFENISSLTEWEDLSEKYFHLIEKNEKLREQIKLEKAFLEFEKNYTQNLLHKSKL